MLIVGAAAASTNGSISGTVVDENDQPLPGVTVNIEMATIGYFETKVTNTNGVFSVGNLKPANYTLTFTMYGYSTLKKDVMVQVGQNVTQTFVMTASQ